MLELFLKHEYYDVQIDYHTKLDSIYQVHGL